jgi:ribosomal protein L14
MLINIGVFLNVIDSSGVKKGKCLCCYKSRFGKSGIGSLVLIVAKSILHKGHKFIKNNTFHKGVIVKNDNLFFFLGGHFGKCLGFSIILLKQNGDILSNRVKGAVSLQLRKCGFTRVLAIAKYVY